MQVRIDRIYEFTNFSLIKILTDKKNHVDLHAFFFKEKHDSVAQQVEHYTFNVRVPGSNPGGITKAGLTYRTVFLYLFRIHHQSFSGGANLSAFLLPDYCIKQGPMLFPNYFLNRKNCLIFRVHIHGL